MGLREDIIEASKRVGIDPFKQPFKPSDLGLVSSDYGSFSDHCSRGDTASGKWASDVILKAVERDRAGRPKRYLLIG